MSTAPSVGTSQNANNVWNASSKGGQYEMVQYLVVSKDLHVKQKAILGSTFYPSLQNTDTGFLSINGGVGMPGVVTTGLNGTGTFSANDLLGGVVTCLPTASITFTVPTGATISTAVRAKFGGIILPGFGFKLQVKNLATATSGFTVTINCTTNAASLLTLVGNQIIAGASENTLNFIYAGALGNPAVETWHVY